MRGFVPKKTPKKLLLFGIFGLSPSSVWVMVAMATSRSSFDFTYLMRRAVLRVPSALSRVRSERSGSTVLRSARVGTEACATTSAASASAPPATSARGTLSPWYLGQPKYQGAPPGPECVR